MPDIISEGGGAEPGAVEPGSVRSDGITATPADVPYRVRINLRAPRPVRITVRQGADED